MISSMASIPSSSSAIVRVEKATSEFLIGPDWSLNIDICDTVNSNQMLAKDVVKAVKKRLQHKNPKVQLLALTLLEMMVKNCGDYVHFQIAERNILPEMVKIVRKKTDMRARDKVLTLIGAWQEAFGGPRGKYPQYYMAYEELRRSGVSFPQNPPDSSPIFTPPVTHPQPGYGMPSTSSTRLDQVMAADGNLSLSSLNSMRDILDLLTDMLQAVDPSDRSAVKDEVIVDLVEQCRANQRKLIQLVATTGDEELLGQGLDLNDSLQSVLERHDLIASGSIVPPPPPPQITTDVTTPPAPENRESSTKSADASMPNDTPPLPSPGRGLVDDEDEEEDDFAQLARRHSKTRVSVPSNVGPPPEASSNPAMSNALVPIDAPATTRTHDQDIIDLLSLTLSTDQTSQPPISPPHTTENIPSTTAYPGNTSSLVSNDNYIAPWAQPQPRPQPQPLYQSQPRHPSPSQPQPFHPQPLIQSRPEQQQQPQEQLQYQYATQLALRESQPQRQPQYNAYPPPPWAPTPGYFNNQRPYSYPNPRTATPSSNPMLVQYESVSGEKAQVNFGQGSPATTNVGAKPFIPTYRLFEDLNVFGNADGRSQAAGNASSNFSGSNNNHNIVGGRK